MDLSTTTLKQTNAYSTDLSQWVWMMGSRIGGDRYCLAWGKMIWSVLAWIIKLGAEFWLDSPISKLWLIVALVQHCAYYQNYYMHSNMYLYLVSTLLLGHYDSVTMSEVINICQDLRARGVCFLSDYFLLIIFPVCLLWNRKGSNGVISRLRENSVISVCIS